MSQARVCLLQKKLAQGYPAPESTSETESTDGKSWLGRGALPPPSTLTSRSLPWVAASPPKQAGPPPPRLLQTRKAPARAPHWLPCFSMEETEAQRREVTKTALLILICKIKALGSVTASSLGSGVLGLGDYLPQELASLSPGWGTPRKT